MQQLAFSRVNRATYGARQAIKRQPLIVRAFQAENDPKDPRTSRYNINVHGRHVNVDEKLEMYVKTKIQESLHKFEGAEFLESEGGVRDVDVRLMNTNAHIKMHPVLTNKELHDTYLRMGELKAEKPGNDVYDSFNNALDALEKKLHKWSKAVPVKKDLRVMGGSLGKQSIGNNQQHSVSRQQSQMGAAMLQPPLAQLANQLFRKSAAPGKAQNAVKRTQQNGGRGFGSS